MALETLKTDLMKVLAKDSKSYDKIASSVGFRFVHSMDIDPVEVAKNSLSAIKAGIVKQTSQDVLDALETGTPAAFQNTTLQNFVKLILAEWNAPVTKYGMNVLQGTDTKAPTAYRFKGTFTFIIRQGATKVDIGTRTANKPNYQIFGDYIGKRVFKEWKTAYPSLAKKVKTGVGRGKYKTDKIGKSDRLPPKSGRVTHTQDSVYGAYLAIRAKELQAKFTAKTTSWDFMDVLFKGVGIKLLEKTTLVKGIKQSRIIRTSLQNKDIPLPIEKKSKAKFLSDINKLIKDMKYLGKTLKGKDKAAAIEQEASTSFKKQATQAATHRLVKSIVKSTKKTKGVKVRVKGKTVKPKNHQRKATLKKPTRAKKPSSGKVTLAQKITVAKFVQRREKGTTEKKTQEVQNLTKLRSYIDKRLGAETRRNMGRPQLINRTGRFSNSVKLLKLTEAQNTIVAKYTYMLSPYETFENTGEKSWPLAYNPKTLIAKSIRNLAIGQIEKKLTLRRV